MPAACVCLSQAYTAQTCAPAPPLHGLMSLGHILTYFTIILTYFTIILTYYTIILTYYTIILTYYTIILTYFIIIPYSLAVSVVLSPSFLLLIHCPKSNQNFRDITRNVEENEMLHEIVRILSSFPRYILCYISENRLRFGQCMYTVPKII